MSEIYLPDKLVLKLTSINKLVSELSDILKYHMDEISLSAYTELGNDLNYSLKEIKNFKPKLKSLLDKEAEAVPVDLFGNTYRKFSKYKYIEILFSEDFRTITSIRMVGRADKTSSSSRRRPFIRYAFFNLENIFDLNIINILHKAEEIKNTHQLFTQRLAANINTSFTISPEVISSNTQIDVSFPAEISRIGSLEFLNRYFIPVPQLYKKPSYLQTSNQVLDSILRDTLPRDWQQLLEQSESFGLLDTKEQVYFIENIISPFNSNSVVSNLARKGEEIRARNNNTSDPLDCVIYLYNSFFDRYDLCYITQDIAKQLIPDPALFIMNMSVIDMFTAIDSLPEPIADAIYKAFEGQGISLTGALNRVQLYIDSNSTGFEVQKRTCKKIELSYTPSSKTMKMKDMFRELKKQYPDLYGDIEKEFNESFSREIVIGILREFIDLIKMINFCNFKLPKFNLPTFEIRDLFISFSFDINNFLLNLVCGLLSELMDILVNLLLNVGKLDEFFVEAFISGNEGSVTNKWEEYVTYATFLLFQSNSARTNPQIPVDRDFVSSLLRSNSGKLISSMSASNKLSFGKAQQLLPPGADPCDVVGFKSPSAVNEEQSQVRKMAFAKDDELLKDAISAFSDLNEADMSSILRRVSRFNFCSNSDFFTTSGIKDEKAIDVLRYISSQLQQTQTIENPLLNSEQISSSLRNMITQVQSVLSEQELISLITGSYDDTIAEIVRAIGKINFPSLSDKVDPVKYFTMLGKIMGGIKQTRESGAIL